MIIYIYIIILLLWINYYIIMDKLLYFSLSEYLRDELLGDFNIYFLTSFGD